MPECVLCQSQSFDVMDGLYFCVQCGTQSQDVREEVVEHELGTLTGKLAVKAKKGRQKKEKVLGDYGKPWFTLEGFQVVIKAQVEFLMKIGIDPAIKDVIGQMWFTFVERSSNAFGTRQDENYSEVTKRRDDIKDFMPTDSIHRKTPKNCYGRKKRDDALELSSEIAREDFYEDDDPTRGLFDDDDDDDDEEEEDVDAISHVGSIDNQSRRKTYNKIQTMTLQHTLAFCFLGLQWLQEPVCLSDLIRWAVEGHLPYFNATALFPSHMKLSQADITMFTRTTVPNKFHVNSIVQRLDKFISLPDMPRHQINIYIARYAIDLQLPASIYRHVGSVMKMIDWDLPTRYNRIHNYDDLAVACIIISLRLIYGLDGVTEHELSKNATDINQDENLYFPIWNDVIDTIYRSLCMRVEHGVPWNKEDLSRLKDCRNYGKFCQDKLFGSWKPESTVHRYRRQFKGIKGTNAEKQDEYANMFGLLLKTDNEEADESNHPTSFPFLAAMNEARKRQSNDGVPEMKYRSQSCKQTKGLRLDAITSYYARENKVKSGKQSINKNRYIIYDFPAIRTQQLLDEKCWNDAPLPGSLRQLVELCSKFLYCKPAVLFNVIRMLEKRMFEETDD